MEGRQADITVDGEDGEEPGILGSALSLPHTDLSDTQEEDHHHDDIVEHLDVIGNNFAIIMPLRGDQWVCFCTQILKSGPCLI